MAKAPTPLETEDQFYEILAGGGRAAMLCAMVDLGLDRVLSSGARTADEVAQALGLDPARTRKWMILLATMHLVDESTAGSEPRYSAGALAEAFVSQDRGYFYREFLRYWRAAAAHDVPSVLRGAQVPYAVRYPPRDAADVALLHDWMRSGVAITLEAIGRAFDFSSVKRVLDVGGGDATMASELARIYPHLELTVYNTPEAAAIGRPNVEARGMASRVSIVEGDFLRDDARFPDGFDLVMFSRVLADWPPSVCAKLLALAHGALTPAGKVLISEPLRDDNPELSVAWEHSYLPYDDFGAYTYKTVDDYRRMLAAAGFTVLNAVPRAESIHGSIVAQRG